MTAPYFEDDHVVLFHGDCRELLAAAPSFLDLSPVGVVVADPPYGETSLPWDRWQTGWVKAIADAVPECCSLWCFGSMRMFLEHVNEFADWSLSQDVVWRKQNGTGFAADRFRRVHEHVLHWYRGSWNATYHETPRIHVGVRERDRSIKQGKGHAQHMGKIGDRAPWVDDGTRLTPSVLDVPNMWRRGAIHPTEKPIGLLDPLIRYACPSGGWVLDPFAGSGSTLAAAREAGYRAIGIEADEAHCERAATRLGQGVLDFGEVTA